MMDVSNHNLSNNKLINLRQLKEISGDDPVFISSILQKILNQIPNVINNFNNSLEVKDWSAISSLAHKTKSTVMHLGSADLSELMGKIENHSKHQKNLDQVTEWIHLVSDLLQQVVVEVEGEMKNFA